VSDFFHGAMAGIALVVFALVVIAIATGNAVAALLLSLIFCLIPFKRKRRR
jgi:hypothetical protein